MNNLGHLIFFTVIAAILVFWYIQTKHREKSIIIGKRLCRESDLQLLDETVSLSSIKPIFHNMNILLVRTYRFEYSHEGSDREHGKICLIGEQVRWVEIDNEKTWYS